MSDKFISAIIPTLGRPDFLKLCLESLLAQTVQVSEVIIVHCGTDDETQAVALDACWDNAGFEVHYHSYPERNAAQQRDFAIHLARHNHLLLLDDDIELERTWVEELFKPIWGDHEIGATMGQILNQSLSNPTPSWRIYRQILYSNQEGFIPGHLIGAALPNGFPKDAREPILSEWIGGGVCAIRRDAYESVDGFADFFTGSCPGEDLDLGFRLSRQWKVFYIPTAKCIHHQAFSGRERSDRHQYLSMRSRFGILKASMGKSRLKALAHIALWAIVQSFSEILSIRKGTMRSDFLYAWWGRIHGFLSCMFWQPELAKTATLRVE